MADFRPFVPNADDFHSEEISDADRIRCGGATFQGDVEMNTNKITGLGDPTAAQDGATKAYVDSVAAEHEAIRELIHFIDDGPAAGFASGAFKETLPLGNPFPTSIIWWESNAKAEKIVELTITYSGAFPVTEVWRMYDADGSTVNATITDTITYSGAFEKDRTRAAA